MQNQALFLIAGEANHMPGYARRHRSRDVIVPCAGHPSGRDSEKLEGDQHVASRQSWQELGLAQLAEGRQERGLTSA